MTSPLSVTFAFLTNFASIALLGCSAWLITKAAEHPELAVLSVAVVGVRFFGLSKSAFRYLERIFSHNFTLQELARIRSEVLLSLAQSPHSPLATASSSELVGRFIKDVDTLGERYIRGVFPILNSALGCFVSWSVLVFWNPVAGFSISVAHFLLGWIAPTLLAYARFRGNTDIQLQQSALRTQFGNLILLRNDFMSTGTHLANIADFVENISLYTKRKSQAFSFQSVQGAFSTTGPIILFLIGLLILSRNGEWNSSPANAAAFLFVAMASFELTSSVGTAIETLLESQRARSHVGSLLKTSTVMQKSSRIFDANALDAVKTDRLTHHYTNAISPVLENFSATLPHKSATFLKGCSGSGKSTLLNILVGTLAPNSGNILLQSPDTVAARHRDHIFAATLRDNLLLGNSAASCTDIENALQRVELAEWVKKLPQGLDTFLGDGGASVSGGERQRILLARALLTPSFLLCVDECTAHLPSHQEDSILTALINSEKIPNLIIASHRDPLLHSSLIKELHTISL